MKHIDDKTFRREVESIMRQSISTDYVGEILDTVYLPYSGDIATTTVYESIKRDVEETSAWADEGNYNGDDIKLAIGRVLIEVMQF